MIIKTAIAKNSAPSKIKITVVIRKITLKKIPIEQDF